MSCKAHSVLRPTVSDGTVYCGNGYGGNLYAFDAATGRERWRFGMVDSLWCEPAVTSGSVYVGGSNKDRNRGGKFYALDAATGRERWRLKDGRYAVVAGGGRRHHLRWES